MFLFDPIFYLFLFTRIISSYIASCVILQDAIKGILNQHIMREYQNTKPYEQECSTHAGESKLDSLGE